MRRCSYLFLLFLIASFLSPIGGISRAADESVKEGAMAYAPDADGADRICVRLNAFFIPTVFAMEGQRPRIVVDIPDVSDWEGPGVLEVDGALVHQARSYLHTDENRLRIVLDLKSGNDCKVYQTYYREENIYCLTVK